MKHGADDAITNERAADERYRTAIRREESRRVPVHQGYGDARRTNSAAVSAPQRGALIGRVELAEATDLFDGTNFYIGYRQHDGDGLTVFSWAAPIASTFFRGGRRTHDLCSRVTTRRTLLRRNGQIVDYIDDDGPAPRTAEPFAPRKLSIPKPPTRRPLASPSVPQQRTPQRPTTPLPAQPVTPRPTAEPPKPRAERAVLAAISAPRQERLASVLATLQPDQYEHVTANPAKTLVIQGHPGTGKTVIAAHRAAFLVHADNKQRCGRVLVVGPTAHYVDHIRGVLNDLVEKRGTVDAKSVDEAMLSPRGVLTQIDDNQPKDFHDADTELGQLAERAAHLLRNQGQIGQHQARADGVRLVYEALRLNTVGAHRIARDREWSDYLRALPTYGLARTQRRYLALMAACGVAVAGKAPYTYDHIIVDEAQDITGLEWAVLKEFNPDGSWTLLGDMNQRRSDLSCHGWPQVAEAIGCPLTITTLRRGYRSTAAIMQFAGQLLPKEDRALEVLQTGGIAPRVAKVRPADLYVRMPSEVSDLLTRHPDGTVAVIDTAPREARRALRRAGYRAVPTDPTTLIWNNRQVRVLDPQEARGLEFDAAVVTEPSDFPARLGRHGLLYTSLTRANRELVVVHAKPLPKALRTRSANRTTPATTRIATHPGGLATAGA